MNNAGLLVNRETFRKLIGLHKITRKLIGYNRQSCLFMSVTVLIEKELVQTVIPGFLGAVR